MTPESSVTTPAKRGSRRRAWAILAFVAAYIGVQLFMIVQGHFTLSKHFGFWMFPESTYFTATLGRVTVDGREIKTDKGVWTVQTASGKVRYKWQSFVKMYKLDRLETRERSKGTFDDTVKYFQAALNYVAERIPEDKSTYQLVMKIRYQRAGGPKQTLVLHSKPRLAAPQNGGARDVSS